MEHCSGAIPCYELMIRVISDILSPNLSLALHILHQLTACISPIHKNLTSFVLSWGLSSLLTEKLLTNSTDRYIWHLSNPRLPEKDKGFYCLMFEWPPIFGWPPNIHRRLNNYPMHILEKVSGKHHRRKAFLLRRKSHPSKLFISVGPHSVIPDQRMGLGKLKFCCHSMESFFLQCSHQI